MRAIGNQRLQLPELSDAEKRNIEINDQLLIRSSQTIVWHVGVGRSIRSPNTVISPIGLGLLLVLKPACPLVTFDNLTHRTYTHIAYSPHFALRNRIPTLRDSQARALRTAYSDPVHLWVVSLCPRAVTCESPERTTSHAAPGSQPWTGWPGHDHQGLRPTSLSNSSNGSTTQSTRPFDWRQVAEFALYGMVGSQVGNIISSSWRTGSQLATARRWAVICCPPHGPAPPMEDRLKEKTDEVYVVGCENRRSALPRPGPRRELAEPPRQARS